MRPSRLRKLGLAAALMVALAGGCAAQVTEGVPGPPAAGRFSVSGTAVDAVTGHPVGRALVTLLGGSAQHATLTDGQGRFRFEGLPAGPAALTTTKPGYFSAQEIGEEPLVVPVGSTDLPVVLTLTPAGRIAGRVTDSGDPVEDLPVALYSRSVVQGRWEDRLFGSTATDHEGQFRFPRLPAGRYFVQAGPSLDPSGMPPPKSGEREKGFPAAFYPAAGDSGRGAALVLRAGQHARADISVQEAPLYQISGEVTGYSPGSSLTVGVLDLRTLVETASAFDPATGKFVSQLLPRDRYRISVQMAGGTNEQLFASREISVDADVTGVRLALAPVAPVPVQVRVVSTRPAAGPQLRPQRMLQGLILTPADDPNPGKRYWSRWSNGPDGPELAVAGVPPGTYEVEASTSPPWYAQSITQGGTDLTREELVVSAASPAPIEVELHDDAGSLEGTLQSQGPPGRSFVLCLPVDGKLSASRLGEGRNGKFQIGGLPPGDYDVLAFDSMDGLEYADPKALESYRSAATRVTVAPNATASVSLEVLRRQP